MKTCRLVAGGLRSLRGGLVKQSQDLRNESLKRFRAMADMPLDRRRKLAKGLMEISHEEQGVVAKTVVTPEFGQNPASASPF